VAVIDPSVQQIQFSDTDFRVEWYSGTGAGGQHRNKHQNSARITHIPTGVVATAQCRSRINSLEQARATLLAQLTTATQIRQNQAVASERKLQVGSGMRGDKIRTYRFQDDTVKDHITEKTSTVSKVMRGYFDLLW
jgi:peptide chain release factor 1